MSIHCLVINWKDYSFTIRFENSKGEDIKEDNVRKLAMELAQIRVQQIRKSTPLIEKLRSTALQAMEALGELGNNANFDMDEAQKLQKTLGSALDELQYIQANAIEGLKAIATSTNTILGNEPNTSLILVETAIKDIQRAGMALGKAA